MNHNSDASPNRLLQESSLYLQQHAYNPVDWQPWGEEAWQQAQRENKLVWVSIGYSACHWCHVMEKECFEDNETAEIMNHHFVCIKVDREERPDVDSVYMDACQIMTGRGGWPLNVCCTPDRKPVYAGTYFPKAQWQQVLLQISQGWKQDPQAFRDYALKLMGQMQAMNGPEAEAATSLMSQQEWRETHERFCENIDWEYGGLNRSPKFMLPNQHEYNLDYLLSSESESAREYLHLSLIKMSQSGIYDCLRGGFYRYSTDRFWFAPHFEKMLYDNAQLISLYARAFAYSKAELYRTVALECLQFANDELRVGIPFGCALDADSEGHEGYYYTFPTTELETHLDSKSMNLAHALYTLKPEGNWENNRNILHGHLAPLQAMEQLKLSAQEYTEQLKQMKSQLRAIQDGRVRPGFDSKVLCSWNGLMLKALADASLFLPEPQYGQQAKELANWMWESFKKPQSLHHAFAQGQSYIPDQLEDYALFAQGLLALHKAMEDSQSLQRAEKLVDEALKLFYDPSEQQLWMLPLDQQELPVNKSDRTDDVINSSSSTFAWVCWELGQHLQRSDLSEIAQALYKQTQTAAMENPAWYSQWLRLGQALRHGGLEITLCGPWANQDQRRALLSELPSWCMVGTQHRAAKWTQQGKPEENNLYLCSRGQCFAPVQTPEQLWELIDECLGLS